MGLRLGIDTGGTYTDAVLVGEDDRILTATKRLTTRHDLTQGIGQALDDFDAADLKKVELVSLSTTLSTNSVVEGLGDPVAVLLPGYGEAQVRKSGLLNILDADMVATLEGGHDAMGRERRPLNEEQAKELIRTMDRRASAFAISSMFGVRNPAHEVRLRQLVKECTDKPVTCGHELAQGLDAPRRALTVALNARMVPIIRRLILAVQQILDERGIEAPLMMVKGNGSMINTRTALEQPVGTVLSGPAASVVGACALSGAEDAIIADMGGTTTDIAVVSGGRPELGDDGVLIGNWKPMVEAVRVISIGLGGDSEVRFSGQIGKDGGVEVGPRRVVPLSLLGSLWPETRDRLARQLRADPGRRNNRFALPLEVNDVLMQGCSDIEVEAWERVSASPVELEQVVAEDRALARAIARLQRKGMVIYSGFTPSDAAHVLGLCSHWCAESARLAALIWARQMRHVYGFGRWCEGDAESPSRQVFERISQAIGRALIEAGLHQVRKLEIAEAGKLTGLLADMIYESAQPRDDSTDRQPLFQLDFARHYPVVGVGAPAAAFFPDPASRLGIGLQLPERAEVANAYGAVMGGIVQRASITITQPLHGQFIAHGQEPARFSSLEEALAHSEQLATDAVRKKARDAGAGEFEILLSREDNQVQHDVDGDLFLETRVIATAAGRPSLKG